MTRKSVVAALGANKHFLVFLGVIVLALTAAAGTPAKRFVTGASSGVPIAAAPTPIDVPSLDADGDVVDNFDPLPIEDAPPPQDDPGGLVLPPEPPPPPPKVCSTDAVTELNDQLRGTLVTALGGQPVPGESLNTLIQLAAGCSDADPTGAVLDLALDFAKAVPDLGLPFLDLPDLPAIPALPSELAPLLAPLRDPIRQGCSQLATVALVLVVAPPAFQIPLSQSDIIQFLAPASAFCAIFDDAGAA